MPDHRPPLSRRRFLRLAGGSAVTVAVLSACRDTGGSTGSSAGRHASSTTAASAPGLAPSTSTPAADASRDRVLVLVQLNGGNDGLSALVPADGRYRDARPTLAVPEADLVALPGLDQFALHPALGPLGGLWTAGRLAFVEAIGFPDPDRSHFVAMDTWWRAGDPSPPSGWLGRVLDAQPSDPGVLEAVALGAGAPLLNGQRRTPTVVLDPAAFQFGRGLDADALLAMTAPPAAEPLTAMVQAATARAVEAVEAFDQLVEDAGQDDAEDAPAREGGADLASGLATASELVTGGVGARIVVVSAGGFDTHANQAATLTALYADLAAGLTGFMAAIKAAGMSDRVLLATTSEFGRRLAENGSGGTDHGAGGLSMLLGPVNPGVHGELDLGTLHDGDVMPAVDPRTLYTASLDWLGVDAAEILGRRYDEVTLLAG